MASKTKTDAADAPKGSYFTKRQIARAWEAPPESDESMPRYGGHNMQTPDPTGEGIEAERLSHLVLGVSDLDRSEEYYRDFFGMEVLGRGLTAEPAPHSLMQMNTGQFVLLVQQDKVVPERPGTNGTHHAFTMTPGQYRRMLERVKERKLEIGVYRASFLIKGEYTMNFTDPDGHRLEINCTTQEAYVPILPDLGIIDCGPADGYKLGAVKLFKEADFFLVRTEEGFLANSRWCTHMNGRVIWEQDHWRFRCPYHRSCFDRHGNCVAGQPNLNALRLHPITFSDTGHVLVDTGTFIERSSFSPEQAVQPGGGRNGRRTTSKGAEPAKARSAARA